ncbi:hypothetical protein EPUS_07407 [Endocarpon pusillum Z07020]|uniref:Uncharacterized protein n=1 Tax=Endocarpon pusillum (strain Z07020 / HMAS-L-300199) TaxID=1263415 RepID=U1GF03_ENDPU|nr:uncharacterized protein EPUS_07407 [Endocarpon pusillum Z07020]ERF76207.1 hypothetical protein EPUS_07407 [Endocarpon pusillum Z07020]
MSTCPCFMVKVPRHSFAYSHEIMERSDDHTSFAWGYGKYSRWDPETNQKLAFVSNGLAASAWNFYNIKDVQLYRPDWLRSSHYGKTNKGILMKLPALTLPDCDTILVALNCIVITHSHIILAHPLIPHGTDLDVYERFAESVPVLVPESDSECRSIYITSDPRYQRLLSVFQVGIDIDLNTFWDQGFSISLIYPPPLGVQLKPIQKLITLEYPDTDWSMIRYSTIL